MATDFPRWGQIVGAVERQQGIFSAWTSLATGAQAARFGPERMRIKNKEIRRRRHRKEQTVKAAQKATAAQYANKPAPAPAAPKPKAGAKKEAAPKPAAKSIAETAEKPKAAAKPKAEKPAEAKTAKKKAPEAE